MVPPPVIRTLECLQEKPRESTRSKSRESTRRGRQPTSDRTTQRIEMQGQVNSKSLQVPLQRRSEGAAIQQRPGAPTSSTTLAFGLLTMSALLLWLVLQPSQGATSGTLALWTAFTPAQAVAAALSIWPSKFECKFGASSHALKMRTVLSFWGCETG